MHGISAPFYNELNWFSSGRVIISLQYQLSLKNSTIIPVDEFFGEFEKKWILQKTCKIKYRD